MKRNLLSILLGLAAAALPSAGLAQSYPAAAWLNAYQPIPIPGGSAPNPVVLTPNGDTGQVRDLPLPPEFDFKFFGTPYTRINVGAKGYITFGNLTVENSAANASPSSLLSTSNPKNLVAAWWGNHFCDPATNEIQTQILGSKPDRRFVIQWHCSRKGTTAGSNTRFQAQLWLYEGSNVIRASYGQAVVDPADDWVAVSWGIKSSTEAGVLGPNRMGVADVCNPSGDIGGKPRCTAAEHFPRSATIQYGRSPRVDLTAAVETEGFTVGDTTIELRVRTVLRNLGVPDAAGVKYDIYVSQNPFLNLGGSGNLRIHRHETAENVPGGGSKMLTDVVSFQRPQNGIYYPCVVIDPDSALGEFDRTNNVICSAAPISLGPDLTGSIVAPAGGEPNLPIEVPIEIRNVGTARAGAFNFWVIMDPDDLDGTKIPAQQIYMGRVEGGLAVGQIHSETIPTTIPSIVRGDLYTFVLEIDPENTSGEVNRANNVVRSPTKMANRKPFLQMTRPVQLVLPDGCFYGERLEASFEACNLGQALARNFYPGVVMGEGSQMSLLDDVAAATFPQSCHGPESPNFHACEPFRGKTPHCVLGTCRTECTVDADCGGEMVCHEDIDLASELGKQGAKSCQTFLSFPPSPRTDHCKTYRFSGRIPVTDQNGRYYEDGKQRFHFTDDVTFSLSESLPDQFSTEEFDCRAALPDLVPTSMAPSARMVAGEITAITRRIENQGFVVGPRDGSPRPETLRFDYGYYVSRTRDISIHQIPLEVVSTGGTGVATVGRKGANVLTDLVKLPANLSPGEYYIGVIADPHGEHLELSKANNVLVHPQKIVVEASSLAILTSGLPTATVGGTFTHQLVAAGGSGPYRWSAAELPPGLSLSASGLLDGVAEDVGLFPFTVRLESGSHAVERMLALRIVPPLGSLEITTTALPPAVRSSSYGGWVDSQGQRHDGIRLAASGGMGPYRWALDATTSDNRLPEGLQGPSEEGLIGGKPTEEAEGRSFVVRVTDALGHSVTKELSISVVDSADLVILSPLFAEGTTSVPYDSCIEAIGGNMSADYAWALEAATIPEGLELEVRGRKACLKGVPSVCANYLVKATVEDEDGQSYSASVPLAVECERIQLMSRFLPSVRRGEEVDVRLTSDAGEGASYRLYQGELPAGLALNPAGRISGKVADDAAFGSHAFSLLIRDEAGRQGLNALAITVEIEPRAPVRTVVAKDSGCSSTSSAPAGISLALALLGLGFLRRHRPATASLRRTHSHDED